MSELEKLEVELEKRNKNHGTDYSCPVSHDGICRTSCVCWQKFYISEKRYIRGGFCANGMFQERQYN